MAGRVCTGHVEGDTLVIETANYSNGVLNLRDTSQVSYLSTT